MPLRGLKSITRVAVKMHSTTKDQSSVHGEATSVRLFVDMPMIPEDSVPFHIVNSSLYVVGGRLIKLEVTNSGSRGKRCVWKVG